MRGVGGGEKQSHLRGASPWLMLGAYALWAGAFNSKRCFSTTAVAEHTKMQGDLTNWDNISVHILFLLCQRTQTEASSSSVYK